MAASGNSLGAQAASMRVLGTERAIAELLGASCCAASSGRSGTRLRWSGRPADLRGPCRGSLQLTRCSGVSSCHARGWTELPTELPRQCVFACPWQPLRRVPIVASVHSETRTSSRTPLCTSSKGMRNEEASHLPWQTAFPVPVLLESERFKVPAPLVGAPVQYCVKAPWGPVL